ncbi:PLP-dependent aminotransferase family protein [Gordonia sinesedis]
MQRALARLVADGTVETRPGEGTFVRRRASSDARGDVGWQTAALGPVRGVPPIGASLRETPGDTIAMNMGYPDADLLPVHLVRSALTRAVRAVDGGPRPPVAGSPELRRWFADELGAGPSAGGTGGWSEPDVLIAAGGQAALTAAFRGLAAPGDRIVMESPTYWGAIGAARQAGLTIVPVPRVDGAPSAADLDTALATTGARLCYVQPTFANPTGDVWSPAQRRDILDVAVAHGAFLVEDDWAHDFAIDTDQVPPLATADTDGHVVYVRSLTKSLSPTLRVAGVLARGPARRRIEGALVHSDLYVSPVLQTAALDVVSRAAWRTHRQRLPRLLQERRDALADAMRTVDGIQLRRPAGGLHLWVRLPDIGPTGAPVESADVAARALTAGLAVSPGAEWFPAEPTGPYLRLSYAAVSTDRYRDAAQILAGSLSTAR